MSNLELYKNIGLVTTCYLIGAIPFCYIIAKIHSNKDLTKIGDRNPGGWNLVFNVSRIWGVLGIILDVLKGTLAYFLVLRITGTELIALLAGCAAVAGHNYSPYLKFSGGKGVAVTLGFLCAVHPLAVIAYGIGIVSAIFLIRNMIWGIITAITAASIFLWLFKDSYIYLIMGALLIITSVPKYINRSINLSENFKFRKEKSAKDLFTPKIR
jgi:glycerol-3-phosphate acyltransferase PlsY